VRGKEVGRNRLKPHSGARWVTKPPGNGWPPAGSESCVVVGQPTLRSVDSEPAGRVMELRKFVRMAGADAVQKAEGNTEAPMNGLAPRPRRSLRAGHAGTRAPQEPGRPCRLRPPSRVAGELGDQVPLAPGRRARRPRGAKLRVQGRYALSEGDEAHGDGRQGVGAHP